MRICTKASNERLCRHDGPATSSDKSVPISANAHETIWQVQDLEYARIPRFAKSLRTDQMPPSERAWREPGSWRASTRAVGLRKVTADMCGGICTAADPDRMDDWAYGSCGRPCPEMGGMAGPIRVLRPLLAAAFFNPGARISANRYHRLLSKNGHRPEARTGAQGPASAYTAEGADPVPHSFGTALLDHRRDIDAHP